MVYRLIALVTAAGLVADGHELGSHTCDHGVLPLKGPHTVRRAIRQGNDAIVRAAGVIRERVRAGLSNGCILLLHDGRGTEPGADASQLVAAVPGIITDVRARGFGFATVGELMAGLRDR